MADLEDQRAPNPASLNGLSDDNLGFDDSSLGLDASHLSKFSDPHSQHPFDPYTPQPSSLMADKDYDQSGYGYNDYGDENDFARASEHKGQGHFQSEQFGDLPANFAKEAAAKQQNFPESDNFDEESYVRGESEGRDYDDDDESAEVVQQGSNPFAVDAGKKQTGVAGGAYVDPQDRPIVGFNPFLNEEAGYEKEEEDEHGDVSQEDNEQYHGGPEGESAGREYGDGREDQGVYDRLEDDDDDSYHQRETAQKVDQYEDEGVGSRTDEAAEGHSEDERTEEHSEGDLHSPGELPQRYIHPQETTAFQPEVSKTPGQDDIADFESGQYDGSAYNQREQPGDLDAYRDTQQSGVNFDKGEVYEDGHRDEGSNIPPQVGPAEDDDLGIVNQGFSDEGEPEGGRVIPEEEEITDSEAPTSAIVDTELYEERREGRVEQQIREEVGGHEVPVVHGEEQQFDDDEEKYSRPHANGGDYEKEEINPEDMEYAGTVQEEEYRQRQPQDEDYGERKEDYGDQYRQEEEMEHQDYSQEQVKPEAADVYETSPSKVDFRGINFDDDEEEEEADDKTNEYVEQEEEKTGEAHTSADDDYTARYHDEEAGDHTTSTNRGDTLQSYGGGYDEESYRHTGESEFSSRLMESDLLSTERSYVDNLSNVTSPETIPQPLPSPPEPRNLSSFDPLAAEDSPGLPELEGNVGQHGELFQHGFVAAESNTAALLLTAGEVEGETKFGVDGTAITSTSQNNAFLHSDEEEEEEDEEESQHLDQGQTGTTETETSLEEKSADYEQQQHGAEHMEGNDNALMSMSMEGSFYDDGGELIGGEDRRNQPDNNFFEERSFAEEGSLLDRLDPKQESSYLENHGLGQVIQGESAVDEDRYQPQEEFDLRGSDVDNLEPRRVEEVPPAFEENGIYEEEDKPRGFDSEVDILEPQRVSQTQAVEYEEVADSFVDHTVLDSTANESESSVDSQHLQVQEAESPKEVEDVVSGVGVADVSPEKPEEPAASVEETPAAGKEEPVVAAAETAAPEAAAATAAVGVAVAAAAAAAATATTKTTTTVKKSSAKAGAKTTTTTTTTKVTKETKPAAGKVTLTKKTEVTTTATSKTTTPRKPAEPRPTTATTEKKTPARLTTSPTKPASATTARSSAPAPSPAQPLAARKPKEVKPATPDDKKKPTTTTTPRTPSAATHRTPRPQSATTSTGGATSTTATATTATTRTTRTVTSATTRTTPLAARPKSTPTKLTNGTASTTLDTKSPAKKPGIETKTGSARTPIEKKATPKVDTGSRTTTPAAAAAKSPTKPTTTTPRTPATPKSAEVRSKIGSMENTTHTPGGGHVKIASKKPDFSNVTSKVGSKDKIDHKPGGGNIRIETKKVKVEAKSKVGSLNNATHKPGGGDKKVESQKTSKVQSLEKQGPGSGSEQGAVEVQNGAASEN